MSKHLGGFCLGLGDIWDQWIAFYGVDNPAVYVQYYNLEDKKSCTTYEYQASLLP